MAEWVKHSFGWHLHVVERDPSGRGFQVLPKRWVVERCCGSFGRKRR